MNMQQDRTVSDDQRPTPKPNKISHITIKDDCLGRQPANCKTVYTSSILVVASINIISGALAVDDVLKALGQKPRFRVRETPEWKNHAADLEAEMLKRGMMFEVIDWSEDQGTLPGF